MSGSLFSILLAIVCFAVGFGPIASAAVPLDIPVAIDDPTSGYGLVDAYGPTIFKEPLGLVSAPGETHRIFVLERKGSICVITNLQSPSRTVFLDLTASTSASGGEDGLLGMAFHPGFATNGQFFVYRTMFRGVFSDVLSRFTVSATDPNAGDPDSEIIFISQPDADNTHNGGDLHFGPDGYLYLGLGDNGLVFADRTDQPQQIDRGLFGGLIRIDVDQRPGNLPPNPHSASSTNYFIPADNPWIGATNFLNLPVDPAQVRTEFYAIGFRNPWKFTFDSLNGDLYLADVGNGVAEEIDRVVKGGNYGWPFEEGEFPGAKPTPEGVELLRPFYNYLHDRSVGTVIIGGVVSRGVQFPELEGAYIYADERSGNIWKIPVASPEPKPEWLAAERGIVAFGRDPRNGDVLMVNYVLGKIRRLVWVDPSENQIPALLSQANLFSNLATLAPVGGLVPYSINAPFWSDNAIKSRWFGLIDPAQKIGFRADENWIFPRGAVWVKHFDLEMEKGVPSTARRVETRVLVKGADDINGFTYRWDESGVEARLVPSIGDSESFLVTEGGMVRTQLWQYPSRGDCHACHSPVAGYALGFNTPQLNRENPHGVNQLDWLAAAGYLDVPEVRSREKRQSSAIDDESQPLEHRVRSYLASNCSQCHQSGGSARVQWDARLNTPLAAAGIIDAIAVGPLNGPESRVIAPHNLTNSMILARISDPGHFRMPPIGSTLLDEAARALLTEWISGMPGPEWTRSQLGLSPLEGSMTCRGESLILSGAGHGLNPLDESFYFARQSVTNNFQVVARVDSLSGPASSPSAGLLIRARGDSTAPHVAALRNASGENLFASRVGAAADPQVLPGNATGAPWQRVVRDGDSFSAWESADGANWSHLGTLECPMGVEAEAGLAVASGESWRFATASFSHFSTLSIALDPPPVAPGAVLPLAIPLSAQVAASGASVRRVDFLADGRVVGSATGPPWQYSWTNALAGAHQLAAAAFDSGGLAVTSAPVTITLTRGPSLGRFLANVPSADQPWQGLLGTVGFAIPRLATNLPPVGSLSAQAVETLWSQGPDSPGFRDFSGGRIASAWTDPHSFSFSLAPGFEEASRLTLAFADYSASGLDLRIELLSGQDHELLDTRQVSGLSTPRWLTWTVRGPVTIRVTSLNAQPAVLNGLFLDPLAPPEVAFLEPAPGSHFLLPTPILLRAGARAVDRAVRVVEFYCDNVLIGSATNAPHEFLWTNALAGERILTARAVGEFGFAVDTPPLPIFCDLPPASVDFTGVDADTQGQWWKSYGADGYAIAFSPPAFRPFARVTIPPATFPLVFSYIEQDPRSVTLFGAWPAAGSWHAYQDLEFSIEFLDGHTHPVAMYFLDFPRYGISQTVSLRDLDTGAELDAHAIGDFGEGLYYTWAMRGRVGVKIVKQNDWVSLMGALFVGGRVSPAVFWSLSKLGGTLPANPRWDDDPDHDGRANLIEYALQSDPFEPDEPVALFWSEAGGRLTITTPALDLPEDVRVLLESSSNLIQWAPSSIAPAALDSVLEFTVPLSSPGPNFYRLRFELIP